jgi:uncharacterized protein YoxC
MKSEALKNFSLFIIMIAFIAFIYGTYKVIKIVDKTQIGTSEGIYTSYVTTSKVLAQKAQQLTQNCEDKLCRVEHLLDFVTNIPYHTQTFQQKTPQKIIQDNFGDCDDKSNLLISMLHSLGIEAYFVLVPKHIFVIVPISDERIAYRKGLWINGKKYYILESTSKDSKIGFPLHYKLDDIATILEPFSNQKMIIESIEYKL